jgi:tetratricopeptide (TPR) repeat protein
MAGIIKTDCSAIKQCFSVQVFPEIAATETMSRAFSNSGRPFFAGSTRHKRWSNLHSVKFFWIVATLVVIAATTSAAADNDAAKTSSKTPVSVDATNAIEKEFQTLLGEDDAAQALADKWIRESHGTNDPSSATLTLRIEQLFSDVKKHYEDFLQRNPNHVGARLAYGSFLGDIHEEEAGVKQWEKARELDPKNPAAWNNLANYYGHRGPVKKAFEYYAKAIELDPNEPVYFQNFATTVYLFRKDAMEFYGVNETQVFDKALDLYRKAMKLAPNDFILATDYAESFYGTKPPRYADGLVAWTDALKIARDEIEREGVRIHLARMNWHLGNFDEARRQLDSVTNAMYTSTKKKVLENISRSEQQSQTNAPPSANGHSK